MNKSSREWPRLVSNSTQAREQLPVKSLCGKYCPEQLPQVLAFIHHEMKSSPGIDIYNIQYENSVASASSTEMVEDVLSRLSPSVKRFILPMFRGRNRSIRVEHCELSMMSESQDFEAIETLAESWKSFLKDKTVVSYGLHYVGQSSRKGKNEGIVHLCLQVAALFKNEDAGGEIVFEYDGEKILFELPNAVVACSDCKGYHAPSVAPNLLKQIWSYSFGEIRLSCRGQGDEFAVKLKLPSNSYDFEYSSCDFSYVRDVENLLLRIIDEDK